MLVPPFWVTGWLSGWVTGLLGAGRRAIHNLSRVAAAGANLLSPKEPAAARSATEATPSMRSTAPPRFPHPIRPHRSVAFRVRARCCKAPRALPVEPAGQPPSLPRPVTASGGQSVFWDLHPEIGGIRTSH